MEVFYKSSRGKSRRGTDVQSAEDDRVRKETLQLSTLPLKGTGVHIPQHDEFKLKEEDTTESIKTAAKVCDVEAINTKTKTTTFSDAVKDVYSVGRPGLRRLSKSNICPCSHEYTTALTDVHSENQEDKMKINVRGRNKPNKRKVSWNTARKISRPGLKCELVSAFDDALTLTRPRGFTLPAMVGSHLLSSGSTARESHLSDRVISKGRKEVKSAWQGAEQIYTTKTKDKKRHISLPCPPRGFQVRVQPLERKAKSLPQVNYLVNSPRKVSTTRRGKGVAIGDNTVVEIPKNSGKTHVAPGREGNAVIESQRWLSKTQLPEEDNIHSFRVCANDFEADGSVNSSKTDQGSRTSDYNLNNCGISGTSRDHHQSVDDAPSRVLYSREKFCTAPLEISKAKPRSRRYGHAALVTVNSRLGKKRGNGISSQAEEKTLDKLFEEIKDCRYLRSRQSEEKEKTFPLESNEIDKIINAPGDEGHLLTKDF